MKFLIEKIESEDEAGWKRSLGAGSVELIQSKMLQSNSSMDSFRIAPSSSLGAARRNTSGAKTPSKYGKGRASGTLA